MLSLFQDVTDKGFSKYCMLCCVDSRFTYRPHFLPSRHLLGLYYLYKEIKKTKRKTSLIYFIQLSTPVLLTAGHYKVILLCIDIGEFRLCQLYINYLVHTIMVHRGQSKPSWSFFLCFIFCWYLPNKFILTI